MVDARALAIHRAFSLNCEEKERLYSAGDSETAFAHLTTDDISMRIGRVLRTSRYEPAAALNAGRNDLKRCAERRIEIVPIWSHRYPPLLREVFDPPFLLFVRGSLPSTDVPQCAVVGTRRPTEKATEEAFRFSGQCASLEIPVVSGLASGIDAAAHRGCVAGGGQTVGVLGSGIDRIYPAAHKKLALRIVETGGAILSEYPIGFEPLKHHFPQRNRIISGLVRWVVLIQAPERSGALITADYALDQGRDMLVHAVGCDASSSSRGTSELAETGARVVETAEQMLHGSEDSTVPADLSARIGCDVPSRRPANASDERGSVGRLLARRMERELGLEEGVRCGG